MRDGWMRSRLGDIAEVVMGRQLSPSKKIGERPRPYIRAANLGSWGISLEDILEMDFTSAEETRFACQRGDVLLVEGGNEKSVGCPALVTETEEGLCIQNTVIRCRITDKDRVLPEFLYQYLRNAFWQGVFAELCAGTTIMHLGQKRAIGIEVQIPPVETQRRIVDFLASVDAYIESLQQQVDAARTARNAVLHDLMSTGGDDWTRTTLGGISELISRGRAPSYCEEDGVIVLNQKCIRNGRILLEFARRTDISKKAIPDWAYLKSGDVLINSTGTGTLGRASFVSHVNGLATFDSHVTLVRPRPELCLPAFVGINLNFREDEIESFAGGSTGQTELSRESVSSFPIVLPPMEEQERIVALATSMAEVSTASEKALSNAKALRSGLLADLLSGDHEIPESYDQFLGAA
jgi:restriction endonuclease S subunit